MLPKSLFQSVCAFLNRFGGNIILGVNDNNKEILLKSLLLKNFREEDVNIVEVKRKMINL